MCYNPPMRNRILGTVQAILMLLFLVDCLVLLAGSVNGRSWELDGGLSLPALLILIGVVRHFRTNRDAIFYSN